MSRSAFLTRFAPTRFVAPARRALALLAAACCIGAASAQPADGLQSYDVELLIFRPLTPTATPEDWSLQLAASGHQMVIPEDDPSPFDTGEPAAAPSALASFPALPAAKFQLTAIEETLRRSAHYRPLAHIGWTQPGYPRGSASFVPIDALVPAASGLSGQVAVSAGRFLHLTLDLVYDAPGGQQIAGPGIGQGAAGVAGGRYVLRQSRRMRNGEQHYIDHPEFGVIAVITRSAP